MQDKEEQKEAVVTIKRTMTTSRRDTGPLLNGIFGTY